MSLEASIENFQRDLNPESEVESWERIVSAVAKTLDELKTKDQAVKRQASHFALRFSMGDHESMFNGSKSDAIDESVLMASAQAWLAMIPPVTVAEGDVTTMDPNEILFTTTTLNDEIPATIQGSTVPADCIQVHEDDWRQDRSRSWRGGYARRFNYNGTAPLWHGRACGTMTSTAGRLGAFTIGRSSRHPQFVRFNSKADSTYQ